MVNNVEKEIIHLKGLKLMRYLHESWKSNIKNFFYLRSTGINLGI